MRSGHSFQHFICSPQRLTCFFIFSLGRSSLPAIWFSFCIFLRLVPHNLGYHITLCYFLPGSVTDAQLQRGVAQADASSWQQTCNSWQASFIWLHDKLKDDRCTTLAFCCLVLVSLCCFLVVVFFFPPSFLKGGGKKWSSCCPKLEDWSALLDCGTLLITPCFANFPLKNDFNAAVTFEQTSACLQPTAISCPRTSKTAKQFSCKMI